MKKNGFTLLELLAVIVVLAIIALIVTPFVTKAIDEAKRGAAINSANGMIASGETLFGTKLTSNQSHFNNATYTYYNGIVAKSSDDLPDYNFKGKTPNSGKITINSIGVATVVNVEFYGYFCNGSSKVKVTCNKQAEVEILDAGLYKSGTNEFQDIYYDGGFVPATWDNLKIAYPGAFDLANGKLLPIGHTVYFRSLEPGKEEEYLVGDLVIGNDISIIDDYALSNWDQLTKVTIPNSVTTIGENAIAWDDALTEIIIPDSVVTIEPNAFKNNNNVERITIGNGIEQIGESAFAYNPKLNRVTIKGPATIGKSAFAFDDNLEYLSLGKTVSIGLTAFGWIDGDGVNTFGIKSLTIPDTVINIESQAFSYTAIKKLVIGSGLETIKSQAFSFNSALTDLTIGKNVKVIDSNAFFRQTSLQHVVIPEGVTTLGNYAFGASENLESISLPSTLLTIGEMALYYTKLNTLNIPKNVNSIGNNIVNGCTNLESINVDDDNQNYMSKDGVLFNKAGTILKRYPVKKSGTSYEVPNTVTTIESSAFDSCVTSVIIPDSVTTIGENAFKNVPHIYYNGTATGSPWGAKAIN